MCQKENFSSLVQMKQYQKIKYNKQVKIGCLKTGLKKKKKIGEKTEKAPNERKKK